MSNKGFIIVLGGVVCVAVVYLSSVIQLLPSFLMPFAFALYGMYVIYITRQEVCCMIDCLEYIVSVIGGFIDTLDSLNVISNFSLLDLIIALIIVSFLIIFIFNRRS